MHAPDKAIPTFPPGHVSSEGERPRICKACEVFFWPCPTIDAMNEFEAAAKIVGPLPARGESND